MDNVMATAAKFNWVDIAVVLIILFTVYRSSRKSFVVEAFNLFGIITAAYISLHYFGRLSDFLQRTFPILDTVFSDFICYGGLAAAGYLVILLVREAFVHLFKVEPLTVIDKWGAPILGFLRGVIFVSLLLIQFNIPMINYLKSSSQKSYLGSQLVNVNIKLYDSIYNSLASKFLPQEPFNKVVYEIVGNNNPEADR